MNQAQLNILVRVQARQAQAAIAAVRGSVRDLGASVKVGGTATGQFINTLRPNILQTFGNRLQWTGRQLTHNFTLPIVLAGAAAAKFELDNERAMAGIVKVYGDGTKKFNKLTKTEIPALGRAFEALSNEFAVNRAEVIGIGEAWAQAGSSGLALAKSTKLTLQTMILGEMDAVQATQALISIQAQYGQNTKQLANTIDVLNMVENQTGITMQGLIDGFVRAAGVARAAGVDVRHLAAFLAALTPATGSAATAGNALKTIFSRLMAPTTASIDLMKRMHIEIGSVAWQSANGTQKLEMMARKFHDLTGEQKVYVSSVIASRYQINRFGVLMNDILNQNGYYQRALHATSDATRNYRQRVYELNTVLQSNPQKLKQAWTILQNALADIIQPLLPAIVYLTQEIAKLFTWFGNLNPAIQKLVGTFLIFLAILGPLGMYIGSITTLFGTVGMFAKIAGGLVVAFASDLMLLFRIPIGALATAFGAVFGFIGAAALRTLGVLRLVVAEAMISFSRIPMIMTKIVVADLGVMIVKIGELGGLLIEALTGPWGIAIAIITAAIIFFHKQIAVVWDRIVAAFRANAGGIEEAFQPIADFFDGIIRHIQSAFYSLPLTIQRVFIDVVKIVETAAMKVYELFSYLNPFAHHSPSLVENTEKGMKHVQKHHDATAKSANNVYSRTAGHIKAFNQATNYKSTGAASQYSSNRAQVKKVDPAALASFDQLIKDLNKLNAIESRQKALIDEQQKAVDRWTKKLDEANIKLSKQSDLLTILNDKQKMLQDRYDRAGDIITKYSNAPIKGMQRFSNELFANQQAQNQLQLSMDKWTDKNGSLDDLNNKLQSVNGSLEVARGTLANLRTGGAGSEITGFYQNQVNSLVKQQGSLQGKINNSPITTMSAQLDVLQRKAEELNLRQSLKFDPLTRQVDQLVNGMKALPFDEIISKIRAQKAVQDKLNPSLNDLNRKIRTQQAVVDRLTLARDKVQRSYDRENNKLQLLQDNYNRTEDSINAVTDAITRLTKHQKAAASSSSSKSGTDLFGLAGKGNFPDVGGHGKIGREGGLGDQSALIDRWTQRQAQKLGKMFGGFDIFAPIKNEWRKFTGWWDRTFQPFFSEVGKTLSQALGGGQAGDAASSAGASIKGALGPIKSFVDKLMPVLKSIGHVAVGVFHGIEDLVQVMGPEVKTILQAIGYGFKQFMKQVAPVLVQFKDLIKPLGRAIENLWYVAKPILLRILFEFKVIVSMLTHALKPAFWAIMRIMRGAFEMIHGVLQIVVHGINTIVDVIRLVVDLLTGHWSKAWADLKNLVMKDFKGLLDGVVNIVKGLADSLYGLISGALGIVTGLVQGFVLGIVHFFEWLWDKLVGHSIVPDIVHGIIKTFKLLIAFPKWIWEHILKPIVDFFKWAWGGSNGIKSHIQDMVHGIRDTWNGLKDIAQWIWDHILHPIIHFFVWAWTGPDGIQSHLKDVVNGIRDIWSGLKDIGSWIWDHILKPIVDLFKDLWHKWIGPPLHSMAGFFKSVFQNVGRFIADGINLGISAIDKLIEGLNWVGSHVPGLKFHIDQISQITVPGHASGAVMASKVGSGFRTNGPRAIVGEGNRNHPEYVIPTDPKHRGNAVRLLSNLLGDMDRRGSLYGRAGGLGYGVPGPYGGVPAFGIGGAISGAMHSAWNKAAGIGRWVRGKAATAAFAVPMKIASEIIDRMPNGLHERDWMNQEKNNFYNWAKGTAAQSVTNAKITNPASQWGGSSASYSSGPGASAVWGALRSAGFGPMQAAGIMGNMLAESSFNPFIIQGGGTSTNPSAAGSGGYGLVQWTPGSKLIPYLHNQKPSLYTEVRALREQLMGRGPSPESGAYAALRAAKTAQQAGDIFGLRYERYKLPFQPGRGLAAARYYQQYHGSLAPQMASGGMIPSLADGAYIRRRAGGVLVRVGEGRNDEVVQPVPRSLKLGQYGGAGESNTYNFYGDLEFPNVTSAGDAEGFIRNLKSVADKG